MQHFFLVVPGTQVAWGTFPEDMQEIRGTPKIIRVPAFPIDLF
jgi:hypothetical protein